MNFTDPQILYMVLVLPSLFGLTMIGEGLHKILKSDTQGWISFIFGLIFICVVILAYFFFSSSSPTS